MAFSLPDLPYPKDALAPHISAETLDYHHGRHHAAYVANLNGLVEKDPSLAGKSLDELIRTASGAVFNNAAQIYNHAFYFAGMSPSGGGQPTGALAGAIAESFGDFAAFKRAFGAAAGGHFGSGWAWLVQEQSGRLAIVTTANAGCPLAEGKKPLLVCDVWEHAYYIDYRNARPKYVDAWWNLVGWDFVAQRLGRAAAASA
ncbi:MAG: superoxide dismutase [Deltaproteobacteria bacterium]|nr:superoxide dismutase [Deltaproteobacteria bacterium]